MRELKIILQLYYRVKADQRYRKKLKNDGKMVKCIEVVIAKRIRSRSRL